MTRVFALVATFAVTLGLVLGGAALAPVVVGDTRDSLPEIDNSHYTNEELLPDGSPGQANVTMSADADPQTIVIDPGLDSGPQRPGFRALLFGNFGPETTERDVMPLVNTLVENGHEVRIYSSSDGPSGPPRPPRPDGPAGLQAEPPRPPRPGPQGSEREQLSPLGQELADADAFVTFRTDYSEEELEDIDTFVEEDGRVLVATEPGDAFEKPGGAGFKSTVGVAPEPGYVYNLEENDLNYQRIFAEPAGGSGLTDGVERAMFATASPVSAAEATDAELVAIDGSELSTTRAETDASVLVRSGDVVVVGDTDFLTPENAQRADNDALIGNLADFLVTNERNPDQQPPEQPEPATNERPPRPTPPGENSTERPPEPEPEPTPTPPPGSSGETASG